MHIECVKIQGDIAKRSFVGSALLAVASIVACAIPASVSHAAEAQAPVTGWTPGTVACPGGVVSVFPLIIGNSTSVTRTGSITTPAALSGIQFPSTWSAANCNESVSGGIIDPSFDSSNFTVQPGQFTVIWIAIGSTGKQGSGSNNIAIGGLPTGTAGQAWYDFNVSLNGPAPLTNGTSFSSMQLQYQNTGGLDPTTNGQNLFNIVKCTAGANSVTPSNSILTPFSTSWVGGQTYGPNQPICAGWFPQGTYQSFTNTSGTGFTIQAAQTYNNVTNLAIAGSGNAAITSARITWSGPLASIGQSGPTGNANVVLSSTPGTAGGWWMQDPGTGQWAVAGATPPSTLMPLQYLTATLWLNNMPIGAT